MSLKVMSSVWENEALSPPERLVLLCLAEHADDEGLCYPSIARMAKRTGMTGRGVQKIIGRLIAQGYLSVRYNEGRSASNLYRVTPAPRSPLNTVHPRTTFTPPLNTVPETPEHRSPKPSLTVKEPSENIVVRLRAPKRKPEVPLPEDWVPSDKNIEAARKQNLSDREINHEADKFRNHHISKGNLFRDWDRTWLTWLGNYRKYNPVAGSAKPFGGGQAPSLASIVAQRRLADRL